MLGSTLYTADVTIGATALTFTKIREGLYRSEITVGGISVPVTIQLTPADPRNAKRRLTVTYKYNPGLLQGPNTLFGKSTMTFMCDFTVGSEATTAVIDSQCQRFLGFLMTSGMFQALISGSA